MRRTLGVLALGACTPALAQVETVVVSATRSPQSTLEIPASIDRIYGDEIREASLLLGSYQTRRSAFKFGGQGSGVNAIGDVSRFETNGYRDHSAVTREHLNAKLKVGEVTVVANSLHQPDTQDPLGLTRAQLERDPRQATPEALQFNTKKSISQTQLGARLQHNVGAGRVEGMLYGGQRGVQQLLAIPVATQNAATHSGAVVDLDRNYGGGALRWFGNLASVRLSAGAEYDVMYERRKGYVNNNGAIGALKRDEDNPVAGTDLYAQAEGKFAERWALHGGARTSRVAFRSKDYYTVANANDSGSRTYRAVTPVAGLLYRVSETMSVYGNLGRGFETPTFLELAYRTGASGLNFDLNASTSRHAELGVKTVVQRWARVNAALFDVVTSNEIVVDQNAGGRAAFQKGGPTDPQGPDVGAET